MNGHDRALELAAAAIDFSLTAEERGTVDAHLRGCPACRRSVAGFATDAATIAILPARALDPLAADAILAALLRGPARVSVIRYLAIAALLALLAATSLVVGAELLRRLETPPELGLVPTSAPAPPSLEPQVSVGPSATPATTPSAPPVDPAACIGIEALGDLATDINPLPTCLGSTELTVMGSIPFEGPGFDVCPGREPAWLACSDGSVIVHAPGFEGARVAFARNGDVPIIRPAAGPGSAPNASINGRWLRFTAHFDDRAAKTCRATDPSDAFIDDPAGLVSKCRLTLVVSRIEVLGPTDVPRPEAQARWSKIAGADAFGSPPATHLASITELDGRLYAISEQVGEPSAFRLWTSVDGAAWDEVETGTFQPRHIASDGTRLIALDAGGSGSGSSIDGRSWAPVSGMGSSAQPTTLLGDGTVVYAAGSDGVDAAIWHLEGDAWERAELENEAGWLGAQDASPAVVFRVTPTTRGWTAVGQGPPDGGVGSPQARAWTSTDGLNWSHEPIAGPDDATARGAAGSWPDMEVVVGSTSAEGHPRAWIHRGTAWESGTFNDAIDPREELTHAIESGGQVIAIGYRGRPFEVDRPLSSVVWGSTDGANWWRLPVDDLSQGIAEDVFVTRTGRVLAVGREFQGDAMPDWESAHGPAVYELLSAGGR